MSTDMNIELLDHMGDDLTIANVARVSFNKWKEEFDEKDARLIDYLARHEHTSPFRHTAIQLRCKAPVFLARQLGKHQVGLTWNEVSRRYVDAGIEFFVPDSWRSRPTDGMKQGSSGKLGDVEVVETCGWTKDEDGNPKSDCFSYKYMEEDECQEHFNNVLKYHHYNSLSIYEDMVKSGIAPEQARMVLPQSMMVDWVWTGSLTSFFHVWRLRIDGHAQKEAQDFAKLLEQTIEPLFPHSWKALKENAKTN